MSNVKFKFWLGHTKKMTYAHELSEIGKIIPVFTDDIIPLQSTEQIDMAKREVFHGDILASYGLICWVVVKRYGCFGIINVSDDGSYNWNEFGYINSPYFFNDRCVVGNILENQDFFEGKDLKSIL